MTIRHNTGAMQLVQYRGRRAARLENESLRLTVLEQGGHIAEVTDKATGVNPLWTPPWPSIEPATYDRARHPAYGGGVDAPLLAGIMGHNLCLDIFGGPSDAEAAPACRCTAKRPLLNMSWNRRARHSCRSAHLSSWRIFESSARIRLTDRVVLIKETVENPSGVDRPIGWTQHVTLGPPFLEKGVTEFRASATRSKVFERALGAPTISSPRRVRLAARADPRWRNR